MASVIMGCKREVSSLLDIRVPQSYFRNFTMRLDFTFLVKTTYTNWCAPVVTLHSPKDQFYRLAVETIDFRDTLFGATDGARTHNI